MLVGSDCGRVVPARMVLGLAFCVLRVNRIQEMLGMATLIKICTPNNIKILLLQTKIKPFKTSKSGNIGVMV